MHICTNGLIAHDIGACWMVELASNGYFSGVETYCSLGGIVTAYCGCGVRIGRIEDREYLDSDM